MTPADVLALILFWLVVLLTLGATALVVLARNILHAGFSLALCLFGVAGLYLFLHADFLAAVQLIVYVGGILVLILFAIMFSSHTQEGTRESRKSLLTWAAGGLTSLIVFAGLLRIMDVLRGPLDHVNLHGDNAFRRTVGMGPEPVEYARLGHMLMAEYLLPFEVASVLILAALVGAVVIVRKETR
jgi:NADH-quinone oxidoreductase subunit J